MESNSVTNMQIEKSSKGLSIDTIAFGTFFIGLIIMSFKNFLAFHNSVELFSAVIGFSIFTMCANTFPISKNKFIMVIGIGYIFVAFTDALHAFIYPGMNIWGQGTLQVSSQIWIVARYLEAATLLLSTIIAFSKFKRININVVLISYCLVLAVSLISILVYPFFPQCYTPGTGLTPFKVISEYIISLTLAITGICYFLHRNSLDIRFFIYMELNILLTLISEITFSKFILPNALPNIAGHLLKVLSFYFAYKSVIEHGLNKPYSLLYNNLNKAKETIDVKTSEIELIHKELVDAKSYSSEIEKAFLENEVCSDLLLHKSPLTIYAHSDGKFIFANNKAADFFGFQSPQELIGKTVLQFIPEPIRDSVDGYINETYREAGWMDSFESTFQNINGEATDVSLSRVIIDYKGNPACLCILWDIATLKQVEFLKKDALENQRLLNESLEFNKLIKEFFANLSHELRTPLNVILGALQVIGLNKPDETPVTRLERHEKYYKTVKQNCYRLLRLINNLIDMSKIDAGFYELSLKNENIVSLVEDITLSVAEYVEGKGLELIFDTDVEEKILACDPDKIERVMLNLLSNSIKFTSSGDKILVTLSDEGDNVSISVRDTGIGISKEKLDIIFDRFRQADSSLSRNREGSGIGLSLVKSLIEMHDGTICVHSVESEGTEFIIKLPVKILDQETHNQKNMMCSNNVERISVEFSDIYS